MAKAPSTTPLDRPLTPKMARFVDEYLVDLNATAAAVRAGYSAKTANVQGPRFIGHYEDGQPKYPHVLAAIEARKAERAVETGITARRVLLETEMLAFSDVTWFVLNDAGTVELAAHAPADAMRAIASIKYRTVTTGSGESARTTREADIRLWNKPGVLKIAGRHADVHGFADRMELTGKEGAPLQSVVIYLPDNTRDGKAKK